MIAPSTARQNPFPGLRPFREDEAQLFFGRENQVDTMVNKLASTRFLAVIGTSGSGKSSLVNCGLRPALHRGLMASAGSAWRIAQFRPGSDPMQSLAQALAAEGVLYSGHKDDVPLAEVVETYLRQSAKGVVETFRRARLPAGTNFLVVADQFEELFRYSKVETPEGRTLYTANENAIAFVNLLLQAHTEPDYPIYVVITMRSDFLGDCSQFYGLPEAINQGQYLVPRMTRDERRASIAGPVCVSGAKISPVLLTRLVNDVGDNPDQLSILQHALNRTWAFWDSSRAEGELDLAHYKKIGAMAEALNQHANEAFGELKTPQRKRICEKLFKALTDLGTDPRGIRRPLNLATLTEIAAAKGEEEEVKAVIEVFRDPNRAFLMPPVPERLDAQKVIDISHESLMRVWKRLRLWAEKESDSARRYRRLAETAALEKTGKARLWRDPDLQQALDWKEEHSPTPAWASLYGGDFESAIAFLERSRAERDHELAEAVFARRWRVIRLVLVIVVILIFVGRFIAGDFVALFEGLEAQKNANQSLTITTFFDTAEKYLGGVLRLTRFFGPYLLGCLALAYSVKWVYRRFAFKKILREVALASSKAVREQELARQAYASAWRRLGAYALDLFLFIVGFVAFFVGGLYAADHVSSGDSIFLVQLLLLFVVPWLYHALMVSSRCQATLGMLALGIVATDRNGNRLHFGRATARHFAKILSYITLGIGFFIQPFTSKRQTMHDLISGSVVLVRIDKKKVPWWVIVLCVVLGLVDALPMGYLLLLAILLLSLVTKKS